ncbi:MAG: succinate dehydrogenase cytochrome b subunit [Propionibacteriaceae bacterium]|nr:succinate dehydrogenase cytochrome b subunit [Propionibacteriaceae bacterium]
MRSTVVKKVIMSVTGLIMIGFLLVHMYGNLKMFSGPEAYDGYAHWLKEDILYPLVPHGTFIWLFRFVLLAAVVAHIWSATSLSVRTIGVRGPGYDMFKPQAQTYSERTMRWGGILIAGFIVFHLLQFTVRVIRTGFSTSAGPYEMFVDSFSLWWVFALYAVLIFLICMHIRHGFWSAFQTLGLNSSLKSRRWLNVLGIGVAVVLYIGFMLPPLAVLIGWIK